VNAHARAKEGGEGRFRSGSRPWYHVHV